jgi:hypothetical protein
VVVAMAGISGLAGHDRRRKRDAGDQVFRHVFAFPDGCQWAQSGWSRCSSDKHDDLRAVGK